MVSIPDRRLWVESRHLPDVLNGWNADDPPRTLSRGERELFRQLIFAGCALVSACGAARHPTDNELIERFRERRADFELALKYALQDAELQPRMEPGTIDQPPSLPETHRAAYRRVFEDLGVEAILPYRSNSGERSVSFVISTAGIAVSGSLKEIVWLSHPPPRPPLISLDPPYPKAGYVTDTWFDAYRVIDKDWYLHVSAN